MILATLFSDLFNEFLQTEVSSIDLATKYTEIQLTNYLTILLKRAREEFQQYVYNNAPITINKMDDIDVANTQFNQDLSLVESGLIVDLMGMIYLKDKIREQKLIQMAIYGDVKMYSQANHIKSLSDIYENSRKEVYQKIITYTYLSNKDNLSGLAGKG